MGLNFSLPAVIVVATVGERPASISLFAVSAIYYSFESCSYLRVLISTYSRSFSFVASDVLCRGS